MGPVKEIHKIKIPFLSLTYAKSYKLAKISPENLTKLSNNIVNYVVSSKGETPDQSVAYPIYVIIMANITVQGLHGSQIIETTLRPGKWYMSVSQLNLELVNVLNELDEIYQFEDINEFQLK